MSMNHIFGISNPSERLEILQLFMRIGSIAGEVRLMNSKTLDVLPSRHTMDKKLTKATLIDIIESFGPILARNAQFAGILEEQFGNGTPIIEETPNNED